MLDPLLALGVASNVISFIDLGGKFMAGVVSIDGSVEGSLKENMGVGGSIKHEREAITGCKALILNVSAAVAHLERSRFYKRGLDSMSFSGQATSSGPLAMLGLLRSLLNDLLQKCPKLADSIRDAST